MRGERLQIKALAAGKVRESDRKERKTSHGNSFHTGGGL